MLGRQLVQEKVSDFFTLLFSRRDEVKRRCRAVLQARVEELRHTTQSDSQRPTNVDPTLALVYYLGGSGNIRLQVVQLDSIAQTYSSEAVARVVSSPSQRYPGAGRRR